ncbi:MAG TPA: DUF1802 family protein [Isosphaeraceae bacterium]|nr:DUF1802 family protein [Isosphaeraceae bacterium]
MQPPPVAVASCAVAFKEWAGVCDALLAGRQSILLRKGGIREGPGPGAFVPEHAEFWLYPTAVHQAQQGLRHPVEPAAPPPAGPGGSLAIRALARVELIGFIRDEAALSALEAFHVLTPETIHTRFHYRRPGLWVLGTRIWRREPPWTILATAEHAGCKTWVQLEEALPTAGLVPVLDDDAWTGYLRRLRSVLAPSFSL